MSDANRLWLLLPASIVVSAAMLSATIWFAADRVGSLAPPIVSESVVPSAPASAPPAAPSVDASKVASADNPTIGATEAPVVMAYWFDYQCPFCKQFELTVMPDLYANYVETGKLRIVYKDFEFLGEDSTAAALVARAVWEVAPDKFYDWHHAMFVSQDRENGGWGSESDVLALTKTIAGVDIDKVVAALDKNRSVYAARLQSDMQEGSSNGVDGTPAAVVGDQLMSGVGRYEDYAKLIDELAAKASQGR